MALTRRISRRSLLAAGLAIGAAGLVEACSPAPAPSPTAAPKAATPAAPAATTAPAPTAAPATQAPAQSKPIILRHWTYLDYPDDPQFQALIKEFNATHKPIEVQVDVLPFADLRTKINTSVATGDAPDTARTITYWLGEMEQAGWVEPLDNYVSKWKGKDDIWAELWDMGRPGKGKPLFWLPHTFVPQNIFVRTDWLKEAGLTPPKTHEEFLNVVLKLNKPPERYGWGMRGDAVGFWFWVPFLFQNGLELVKPSGEVDFDSPVAIETTEWYADIHRKHKASQPSGVTDNWSQIVAQFNAGKLAMIQHTAIPAPSIAKTLADKVAPMALPKGKARTWTHTMMTGIAIFKNSKNKDAAWEWVSWNSEPKAQQMWGGKDSMQWTVPVNKSLLDDSWYKGNPYIQIAMEQKAGWGMLPTWHPYWAQWQDKDFMPRWQQMLQGQLAVKDMLSAYAEGFRKAKR